MSLKIRVCENSHSKLYNHVTFAAHTLYMMHPMLNYSHSNPVDTHLKNNLLNRFRNHQRNIIDLLTMRKNCENFEFSHDELNDIYLYCLLCNA